MARFDTLLGQRRRTAPSGQTTTAIGGRTPTGGQQLFPRPVVRRPSNLGLPVMTGATAASQTTPSGILPNLADSPVTLAPGPTTPLLPIPLSGAINIGPQLPPQTRLSVEQLVPLLPFFTQDGGSLRLLDADPSTPNIFDPPAGSEIDPALYNSVSLALRSASAGWPTFNPERSIRDASQLFFGSTQRNPFLSPEARVLLALGYAPSANMIDPAFFRYSLPTTQQSLAGLLSSAYGLRPEDLQAAIQLFRPVGL